MIHRLPPMVLRGIEAAQEGDYLVGLTVFIDYYLENDNAEHCPQGLSWYGLCLAVASRSYAGAIDLCREALAKQPDHAAHYFNLARIYLAKKDRKKALETVDQGLAVQPNDANLMAFRQELGIRRKPTIPFLDRRHGANVSLGKLRSARQRTPAKKSRAASIAALSRLSNPVPSR